MAKKLSIYSNEKYKEMNKKAEYKTTTRNPFSLKIKCFWLSSIGILISRHVSRGASNNESKCYKNV